MCFLLYFFCSGYISFKVIFAKPTTQNNDDNRSDVIYKGISESFMDLFKKMLAEQLPKHEVDKIEKIFSKLTKDKTIEEKREGTVSYC